MNAQNLAGLVIALYFPMVVIIYRLMLRKKNDVALQYFREGVDLTPYILHELCHLLTDPFYAKATNRYATHTEINDERELLTDIMCNIILKTLK